ncbi:MAG: flagellar motor protein MotB [Bdellovibrionota bacterium]
MAKKKKCPEFENHERWLVAFADMMTLLFALFVVLYAIAVVNSSKVKQVTESFQAAFGIKEEKLKEDGSARRGPVINESIFKYIKGNTSREQILQRFARERAAIIAADTKALEQKIAERLYGKKQFPGSANAPKDRVVYIARDPDGIRITLLARKFFAPSSTVLDTDAKKILDGIAVALKGINRTIRAEGHTDNLPFNKNGMTNWELSSTRADSVARYLIETGNVRKDNIYAAGFADTRPLALNDSPEDRSMNRRVDIKILYDQPSDYIPPDDVLGSEKPNKE